MGIYYSQYDGKFPLINSVIPMKNPIATWLPTLLITCVLGPIIGTAILGIFWGQPGLVVSVDLAGGPILYYAYTIILPTVVPASILWCFLLHFIVRKDGKKKGNNFNDKSFFLFSIKLGALFGFIYVVIIVFTAIFAAEFVAAFIWVLAGFITGIICSVLAFPFWNKQRKALTA